MPAWLRLTALFILLLPGTATIATGAMAIDRPVEDEIIYFMLPDRFENGDRSNDTGGIKGDRLTHGYDPTHKGFYHGGDLAGLIDRLDYIEGLGATAIWLGPIFKNKPVQGDSGNESAGYHGYWTIDYTQIDPHLGSNEDFKRLIDALHARGMKLYLDIITNHTADVIAFRECHDPQWTGEKTDPSCPYRAIADYPYQTKGGPRGKKINKGFLSTDANGQTKRDFSRITNPNFAYTPYVAPEERDVKVPAWLNDVSLYHNRGNTHWHGESAVIGDFSGLDDLMTEHPKVIAGFIEIFAEWIRDYGIDGFRIDTTKHVDSAFWQAFLPAIEDAAKAAGKPDFYMFGEVYDFDPGALARFTHIEGFDQLLDFAFQSVAFQVTSGQSGTDVLDKFLRADALYKGGAAMARRQPVFLGNHDMGRFSGLLAQHDPDMAKPELLQRVTLGHALMMFMRGVPVIYYGDEQGFVSDGGDQLARENMFPSQVAVYNDNQLLGTNKTTADSNFDVNHPLYRDIAQMAKLRKSHPALSRGDIKIRAAAHDGSVFVFSRFDPKTLNEYVIAMNFGTSSETVNIEIEAASKRFEALHANCAKKPNLPGSYSLSLPALSWTICRAK